MSAESIFTVYHVVRIEMWNGRSSFDLFLSMKSTVTPHNLHHDSYRIFRWPLCYYYLFCMSTFLATRTTHRQSISLSHTHTYTHTRRQEKIQHQTLENFHRLLQLLASGSNSRWEDILHAWGAVSWAAEHGANQANYETHGYVRTSMYAYMRIVYIVYTLCVLYILYLLYIVCIA